jgi:RNA polymerase sigma factor, sigma-70 family
MLPAFENPRHSTIRGGRTIFDQKARRESQTSIRCSVREVLWSIRSFPAQPHRCQRRMYQRWRQKLKSSLSAAREIRRHGILSSINTTRRSPVCVSALRRFQPRRHGRDLPGNIFIGGRNLSSFQGRSSFQTWLLRIAANKAMDYREKTRAAKRGGNAVHISIDAGPNRWRTADWSAIWKSRPDALLQIAETSRLVRESLDRLGEPCREIIELRYFGELSYDEIARNCVLIRKRSAPG